MKWDCERCLEMRFAERPGDDMKWPRLIAIMKVDLTGLKDLAWKYLAGLSLVVS